MPQYALISDHTPLSCPAASKAAGKHAEEALGQRMPALAEKLDIEILQFLHLDPGHKIFMLVEAPTAEAVRDLVYEGGLMQFNNIDFHLVTPIPEMVQRTKDWERPFA